MGGEKTIVSVTITQGQPKSPTLYKTLKQALKGTKYCVQPKYMTFDLGYNREIVGYFVSEKKWHLCLIPIFYPARIYFPIYLQNKPVRVKSSKYTELAQRLIHSIQEAKCEYQYSQISIV